MSIIPKTRRQKPINQLPPKTARNRKTKKATNKTKRSKLYIAHIYAACAVQNSGDFMLGIATKRYFAEKILKKNMNECAFENFNCRQRDLYNQSNVEDLNKYDYILVGGGGLILPDSSANKISAWQWAIDKKCYDKIKKPIYVISIGYNLFYGQEITMPSKSNNKIVSKLLPLFKNNIETLIKKSKHFTLRHRKDVESLKNIIDPSLHHKIGFEFCPVLDYTKNVWRQKYIKNTQKKAYGIEIKDDRKWRRYHKIGTEKFYDELLKVVQHLIRKKEQVVIVSHDGSISFYEFLRKNNVNIRLLKNSSSDEEKILNNYCQLHTILCTAGHSQMTAYGLGIKTISLVTHPKLRNFCDDVGDNNYIMVNEVENVCDKILEKL